MFRKKNRTAELGGDETDNAEALEMTSLVGLVNSSQSLGNRRLPVGAMEIEQVALLRLKSLKRLIKTPGTVEEQLNQPRSSLSGHVLASVHIGRLECV